MKTSQRTAQARTIAYIDLGLAVYAMQARAESNGYAFGAQQLQIASRAINKAAYCNRDNPRQAVYHAAQAFHAIRAAHPTLPCPPPQDRHPLIRFD